MLYRTELKDPSHFSNELLLRKTVLLTWPKRVFIKKTLIFSKTVD